jgi:hypothetical protein
MYISKHLNSLDDTALIIEPHPQKKKRLCENVIDEHLFVPPIILENVSTFSSTHLSFVFPWQLDTSRQWCTQMTVNGYYRSVEALENILSHSEQKGLVPTTLEGLIYY